jgi:hypothetical protein
MQVAQIPCQLCVSNLACRGLLEGREARQCAKSRAPVVEITLGEACTQRVEHVRSRSSTLGKRRRVGRMPEINRVANARVDARPRICISEPSAVGEANVETLALDWRRHSPHRGALGSSLGRRRDGSQEAEQRRRQALNPASAVLLKGFASANGDAVPASPELWENWVIQAP